MKLDGGIVCKQMFHCSGKSTGGASKLVVALLFLFIVSAYGTEVVEGQKVMVEAKGYEKLLREIYVLKAVVFILLVFHLYTIAHFFFNARMKFWFYIFKQRPLSPTENNETDDEIVNDKLTYSSSCIIGIGISASVFKGTYQGKVRAVKRMLRTHYSVADNELKLLLDITNDYVLRCYCYEKDKHFIYIVSDLCDCNMKCFVQIFSESANSIMKSQFISKHKLDQNLRLWEANGDPSKYLISLIKGIVKGLKCIHKRYIIHRDLKPSNVLIAIDDDGIATPKLSNIGVSKHLIERCSASSHVTGYGTSGWKAQELWSNDLHNLSVDMFSLGCLIFFCVTKGNHPFGDPNSRDANITSGNHNLSVDFMPEVHDLVSKLICHNPKQRLTVNQTLKHPFFWDLDEKMDFIAAVSNTIISEGKNSHLCNLVESLAPKIFQNGWMGMIHNSIVHHLSAIKGAKYDDSSLSSLLKLMRNSRNHFRELAKRNIGLSKIVNGSESTDLYNYYFVAYRPLFMEVYTIVLQNHRYVVHPEFKKFDYMTFT